MRRQNDGSITFPMVADGDEFNVLMDIVEEVMGGKVVLSAVKNNSRIKVTPYVEDNYKIRKRRTRTHIRT